MAMYPGNRFKGLEIESKLLADNKNSDFDKFIEIEKKKYKKSDEVEDLLKNYDISNS